MRIGVLNFRILNQSKMRTVFEVESIWASVDMELRYFANADDERSLAWRDVRVGAAHRIWNAWMLALYSR